MTAIPARVRDHWDRRTGAAADRQSRIETVVRENYAIVWRLARRWGLSSADADDVAQRSVVIASERIDEIALGSERAFLCRTAIHLSSKIRRDANYRAEDRVEDWEERCGPDPNPEQLLERRRARAQLDAILAQLPEELRAVFVLFELELLTQVQVADALELPQGTVASRLRRAREMVSESIRRTVRHNERTGARR